MQIEAFEFDLFGDADAHRVLDHQHDDESRDRAPGHRPHNPLKLNQHLPRIAVDPAGLRGRTADGSFREYTGQKCADNAANAMHAEAIEAVVNLVKRLDAG